MEATRYIRTADKNGEINMVIRIPEGMDKKFEIIVLPVEDDTTDYTITSHEMMRIQQESGFVKTVIGSPDEDVWNELI